MVHFYLTDSVDIHSMLTHQLTDGTDITFSYANLK